MLNALTGHASASATPAERLTLRADLRFLLQFPQRGVHSTVNTAAAHAPAVGSTARLRISGRLAD